MNNTIRELVQVNARNHTKKTRLVFFPVNEQALIEIQVNELFCGHYKMANILIDDPKQTDEEVGVIKVWFESFDPKEEFERHARMIKCFEKHDKRFRSFFDPKTTNWSRFRKIINVKEQEQVAFIVTFLSGKDNWNQDMSYGCIIKPVKEMVIYNGICRASKINKDDMRPESDIHHYYVY
jgi:hypothetical protein